MGIRDNEIIVNYTKEDGLLSNQTGVIKGDGNFLWIATNKGLQRLNTQTGIFKTLTKKDGINSFAISGIEVFEKSVFVSSNDGLLEINKETAFDKKPLYDFTITNVLIEDKEFKKDSIYILKPGENKIQFRFHSNGFQMHNNLQYFYRLLGSSDHWNALTKGASDVTFNSLSPGEYTFELKATNINQ